MSDCLFCKIAAGEIPSTCLYNDDDVYAFRDINPQMPVHIVVAAKRHVPDVLGFTAEDAKFLGGIQLAIAEIARKLNLAENGFRVINNCGKDAKQSVPHLHYHILAGGDMGERIV